MATNLAIDDRLLNEALRVGGQRTKKDKNSASGRGLSSVVVEDAIDALSENAI